MTAPVSNREPQLIEECENYRTYRMSRDEYLDWGDQAGVAEWFEGEVHVDMSVGLPHETAVSFLKRLLSFFADLQGAGRVLGEPFATAMTPGGHLRQPDVFFVARDGAARLTDRYLEGPPDLAVEVISPESVQRDLWEKFHEYQHAGVREYWVVDPRGPQPFAHFWVLDADPVNPGLRAFRPVPISADGIYRSTVLDGLWLRVAWLFQEGASPERCLAEVVGVERLMAYLGGQ